MKDGKYGSGGGGGKRDLGSAKSPPKMATKSGAPYSSRNNNSKFTSNKYQKGWKGHKSGSP